MSQHPLQPKQAFFLVNNETDTTQLARTMARNLKNGVILAFSGPLGSGKTFLCREIIKTLCGVDVNVTSPTFNLLQIYNAPLFDIYHFDLYRLKSPDEFYELGIEDAFNGHVTLIEWPEIISHLLPPSAINVKINILSDTSREIIVD
jgi:tRNA threonylcarbamoyladenosine biosynthesis protein TsaE